MRGWDFYTNLQLYLHDLQFFFCHLINSLIPAKANSSIQMCMTGSRTSKMFTMVYYDVFFLLYVSFRSTLTCSRFVFSVGGSGVYETRKVHIASRNRLSTGSYFIAKKHKKKKRGRKKEKRTKSSTEKVSADGRRGLDARPEKRHGEPARRRYWRESKSRFSPFSREHVRPSVSSSPGGRRPRTIN